MTVLNELGHGPTDLFGVIRVCTEDQDPQLALAALGETGIRGQHRCGCKQTKEESDSGHGGRSYQQRSMEYRWKKKLV
jgi:hypothetical protein